MNKQHVRLGLISLGLLASLSAGRAALHPHPLAAAVPAPATASPIRLHLSVEKQTAAPDAQGKPAVHWAALSGEVHPADLLRYQVEARNAGQAAISDLTVTQPVPAGMAYVGGSAEGEAAGGAAVTYSLDGKRFSDQPTRTTVGPDGVAKTVPASPESYAALRWRFPGPRGRDQPGRDLPGAGALDMLPLALQQARVGAWVLLAVPLLLAPARAQDLGQIVNQTSYSYSDGRGSIGHSRLDPAVHSGRPAWAGAGL